MKAYRKKCVYGCQFQQVFRCCFCHFRHFLCVADGTEVAVIVLTINTAVGSRLVGQHQGLSLREKMYQLFHHLSVVKNAYNILHLLIYFLLFQKTVVAPIVLYTVGVRQSAYEIRLALACSQFMLSWIFKIIHCSIIYSFQHPKYFFISEK